MLRGLDEKIEKKFRLSGGGLRDGEIEFNGAYGQKVVMNITTNFQSTAAVEDVLEFNLTKGKSKLPFGLMTGVLTKTNQTVTFKFSKVTIKAYNNMVSIHHKVIFFSVQSKERVYLCFWKMYFT